jgi:hypothetical protein
MARKYLGQEIVSCFGSSPGLPDGIFSNQKSQFWNVLQWKVLVNFNDISSLLPFGIFYGPLTYLHSGHFGIFFRFGMLYQDKSGNPARVSSVLLEFWKINKKVSLCRPIKRWDECSQNPKFVATFCFVGVDARPPRFLQKCVPNFFSPHVFTCIIAFWR